MSNQSAVQQFGTTGTYNLNNGTIQFAHSYNSTPVVVCSLLDNYASNNYAGITGITNENFNWYLNTTGTTGSSLQWMSIGNSLSN